MRQFKIETNVLTFTYICKTDIYFMFWYQHVCSQGSCRKKYLKRKDKTKTKDERKGKNKENQFV